MIKFYAALFYGSTSLEKLTAVDIPNSLHFILHKTQGEYLNRLQAPIYEILNINQYASLVNS